MVKHLFQIILGLVVATVLVTSCGKVTQDTRKASTEPSFSINFSIEAHPTENIGVDDGVKPVISEGTAFTTAQDTVYVQVSSLEETDKENSLSWAKSLLITTVTEVLVDEPENVVVTTPPATDGGEANPETVTTTDPIPAPPGIIRTYRSNCFDKKGRKVKSSSKTIAYINFDEKDMAWEVSTKKLRYEDPIYIITFYASKDKYYTKVVGKDMVDAGKTLNLGEITDYDTFIAILFYIYTHSTSVQPDEFIPTLYNLQQIFPQEVYSMLDGYSLPANTTKSFKLKTPIFQYNSSLETSLVEIYKLATADKAEALRFLAASKKLPLSEDTKQILLRTLQDFTPYTEDPKPKTTPKK